SRKSLNYDLDSLICIHKKYVTYEWPLVETFINVKTSNFCCLRPQPQVITGVHKAVEMSMIGLTINRSSLFLQKKNMSEDDEIQTKLGKGLNIKFLDESVEALKCESNVMVDAPIVISYATEFKLVWTSR